MLRHKCFHSDVEPYWQQQPLRWRVISVTRCLEACEILDPACLYVQCFQSRWLAAGIQTCTPAMKALTAEQCLGNSMPFKQGRLRTQELIHFCRSRQLAAADSRASTM